jgi:putative ABC transport system permease protein
VHLNEAKPANSPTYWRKLKGTRVAATIALRNVVRQRRRTAESVVAIAFGVVALMLAGGFIEWSNWSLRETTIYSRLGHAQVMRPGYLENGTADPFAYLLPGAGPEYTLATQVPGVLKVAPRLALSGLISHGPATLSFLGEGMRPELEKELNTLVLIVKGDPLSADDPEGILLGQGLAANLGAAVGDKVVVLANTRSGAISGVDAHVRGFFATASKAYDDAAVRMPLPLAQRLLRTEAVHTWAILGHDTESANAMVKTLDRALAGKHLQVVPWYQMADFYQKASELFSKQFAVMKLIIATIIVLSISNTLMMNLLERTTEIGTALALGTRRRAILADLLIEGAILGLIGGLIGVGIGVLAAKTISHFGIPLPSPPGQSREYTGKIFVSLGLSTEAVVLAVVTVFAASIYPAWRASRLVIVDALRHGR